MANLSIRNLPDDIYKELKKLAQENKRSINNELIYLITDNLQVYKFSPKRKKSRPDLFERIKKLRRKVQKSGIKIDSVKMVRELRDEGRF